MDSSDITVINVGGRIAFYPHVDTVEEIAEQAEVGRNFADRAEVIGTLNEYTEEVADEMEEWDTTDGVMHWNAPYDS